MKCKLCGSEIKKIYSLKSPRNGLDIPVFFCKACSVHFCDVVDYDYKNNNDDDLIHYYEARQEGSQARQYKIFKFIQDNFYQKPGAFLDLGSGIGYSVQIAQKLGWQAFGIEPNDVLEEYSRSVLKLDTINGYLSEETLSIFQTKLPFAQADYILVDNVLEHIPNPMAFLSNALNLLRPGGLILIIIPPVDWLRLAFVSIPNIRNKSISPELNLFCDPDQHVNYFSRKAIQILVNKIGGCKLTDKRFHSSKILSSWVARIMQFETGYYFIIKDE